MAGSCSTEASLEETRKGPHRVAFLPDYLLSSMTFKILKLRNPHTDAAAMYMIDNDKKALYQIMAFDEGNRCWFLGQTVESNGKLHIISPVDVTFLILPYLIKSTRVMPLDQVLEDEEFPDLSYLDTLASEKDLSHIADRKGSPDLCVWQYNEDKSLSWLAGRVSPLATLLEKKRVPTSTAQSLTFVKSMDPKQAKEAYICLAHGIISEFIPMDISKKLHKYLKLPDKQVKQKGITSTENIPPKRQKTSGPLEDYSKDNIPVGKVEAPKTAKEKALAKSALGSKNITSFFTKKM